MSLSLCACGGRLLGHPFFHPRAHRFESQARSRSGQRRVSPNLWPGPVKVRLVPRLLLCQGRTSLNRKSRTSLRPGGQGGATEWKLLFVPRYPSLCHVSKRLVNVMVRVRIVLCDAACSKCVISSRRVSVLSRLACGVSARVAPSAWIRWVLGLQRTMAREDSTCVSPRVVA